MTNDSITQCAELIAALTPLLKVEMPKQAETLQLIGAAFVLEPTLNNYNRLYGYLASLAKHVKPRRLKFLARMAYLALPFYTETDTERTSVYENFMREVRKEMN